MFIGAQQNLPGSDSRAGVALAAAILAAVAVPFLCWFLLRAYRRAVAGRTGQRWRPGRTAAPRVRAVATPSGGILVDVTTAAPPSGHPLVRRSVALQRRAAVAYGLAGAVFGLVAALLYAPPQAVGGGELLGILWLGSLLGWPLLPTLATVASLPRGRRVVLVVLWAAFAVVLPLLPWPLDVRASTVLWLALPAMLLVVATSWPGFRGVTWLVAPVTYGISAILVGAFLASGDPAESFDASVGDGLVLAVSAFILVAGVAMLGLVLWSYGRKLVNDEVLVVSQWWLIHSLWVCYLVSARTSWLVGLTPFVVCVGVLWVGLRTLVRPRTPQPGVSLLLLRTFGHQRRSERLLRHLGASWRRIGPIHLIGGLDLAAAGLDPDELVDYLAGRLHRRLVRRQDELPARLQDLDSEPDADGRYRVNEVYCGQEVWPDALERLLDASDVVLLDTRGFTSANPGVRLEIRRLVELTRLDRVLAVVDGTTDHGLLVATLQEVATPGLEPPAALRVFTVEDSSISATHRLFASLCDLAGKKPSTTPGQAAR